MDTDTINVIYLVATYVLAIWGSFAAGKNASLYKANRMLAQRREKWLRVMARQDTVLGEAVIDTTRPIL
jgi:uncharacterized membrane protein